MNNTWQTIASNAANWKSLVKYLGIGSRDNRRVIATQSDLQKFLNSRASHVAQASLFGYLKTRAGTRFPELFEKPDYLVSINIAKWQVWLAALSDLAVFAGGLIYRRTETSLDIIGQLMNESTSYILAETGIPDEAGPDFVRESEKIKTRIANCNWASIEDNESVFSISPGALVRWSPVIDEFKQLDGEIIKNSVRFRWIEVRRNLRRDLDANALVQSVRKGD